MYDFDESTHNDPDASIPRTALVPGLMGLIPIFVLCWSTMKPSGLMTPSQALMALNIYAAIILTFIGALWWGLAARMPTSVVSNVMMGWSVVPAIFAWIAMLLGPRAALEALIVGFVVQWAMDSVLMYVADGVMPYWAYRLRTILTLISASVMAFTAWFIH